MPSYSDSVHPSPRGAVSEEHDEYQLEFEGLYGDEYDDEFSAEHSGKYSDGSPRPARRRSTPSRPAAKPRARRSSRTVPLEEDFLEENSRTPFDDYAAERQFGAPTRPLREAAEKPKRVITSQSQAKAKPKTKKKSTRNFTPKAGIATPRALPYEVGGVLTLLAGVVLLINAIRPLADGWLPKAGVLTLRWLFGSGAVIFPVIICLLGVILIAYRHRTNFRAFGRGMGTAFLVFLTAAHLSTPRGYEFSDKAILNYGGTIGAVSAWLLRNTLGETGAVIALVAFALVALLLFTETSMADTARWLGGAVRGGGEFVSDRFAPRQWRERAQEKYRDAFYTDEDESGEEEDEVEGTLARLRLPRRRPTRSDNSVAPARMTPFEPIEELLKNAAACAPEFSRPSKVGSSQEKEKEAEPQSTPTPEPLQLHPEEEAQNPIEALEAQALASAGPQEEPKHAKPLGQRIRFNNGPYLPEYFQNAMNALDPPIPYELGASEEDTARGVQNVEETLKAFKIDARVTDVKRGPVITRYEVQPAPGVRVATIANLDRDIARSLAAYAVRIEAPVPGRNVVGIEVPNKKVHLVRLRDVLELPEFLSAQSKLAFVLGKDIAGASKWADLTKMPHLLIAGATNSGKSVCLNSVIASILMRATPDEVKFSLIDPKRVELTLFRDIPHLYHPVVVEPKDAVRALRGAIAEMDRRYKLFAERGVRNLASFNAKLPEGEKPLPYLVIVIDELADLMMTAAAEFEKLICRIAQLARATGIHLIVATQRPSVNVITGVIKANIPARIAFAVASQVDSRTILDSVGAERLIGSGDMLFDSNSGGKSVRIQGAFLSEEEVNRVVEVVKAAYAPVKDEFEYGLDLSSVDTEDSKVAGDDDVVNEKRDDLYDEIREFCVRYDEMSASLIQRKFEIGYPRAGRIVDQLERDGVLGPADGPKARKVLGGRRE